MAEIKTIIPQKEFTKGFFIELNCAFCGHEQQFGSEYKKDLQTVIKEAGWRNIKSDAYGLMGYWCGCDYMD